VQGFFRSESISFHFGPAVTRDTDNITDARSLRPPPTELTNCTLSHPNGRPNNAPTCLTTGSTQMAHPMVSLHRSSRSAISTLISFQTLPKLNLKSFEQFCHSLPRRKPSAGSPDPPAFIHFRSTHNFLTFVYPLTSLRFGMPAQAFSHCGTPPPTREPFFLNTTLSPAF
jgi:hypothetical protein